MSLRVGRAYVYHHNIYHHHSDADSYCFIVLSAVESRHGLQWFKCLALQGWRLGVTDLFTVDKDSPCYHGAREL